MADSTLALDVLKADGKKASKTKVPAKHGHIRSRKDRVVNGALITDDVLAQLDELIAVLPQAAVLKKILVGD